MNILALDYGTKRIGLAVSENGFISTLPVIKNDDKVFEKIKTLISQYSVNSIYVGVSEGKIGDLSKMFANKLSDMLELKVETVEEQVSTIEADEIYKLNKGKNKNYKTSIDSVAAAVILRRIIG